MSQAGQAGNGGGGGGGGFIWSNEYDDFDAVKGHGYFCNDALTVTLPPSTEIIGSSLIIFVNNAVEITVLAESDEYIQLGDFISISGGTVTCDIPGSTVELVYNPVDNTWHTISVNGPWSLT